MSDPIAVPESLDDLVYQLEELKRLLSLEFDAIRQRASTELMELAQEKQRVIDNIGNSLTAMSQAQRSVIRDQADDNAKRVRILIRECASANITNGCVIESAQTFTSSLLDILRGRAPGERTYTAAGRLGDSQNSSAFIRV